MTIIPILIRYLISVVLMAIFRVSGKGTAKSFSKKERNLKTKIGKIAFESVYKSNFLTLQSLSRIILHANRSVMLLLDLMLTVM